MERSENDSNAPLLPRSLAAQGDAADISTWSNIPYFFFQAAKKQSFLTLALNLKDPQYEAHRKAWRLKSLLRLRKPVGFQYSDDAIGQMWELIPQELRGGEIISHMQFFPRIDDARRCGTTMSYFIDATLRILWSGDALPGMSRAFCSEILAKETERYHHAKHVVAMARATARSLVEDYKIDPKKVFVVRPGANIDEAEVEKFLASKGPVQSRESTPFTKDSPAILGFIGNDYRRKGLYRLMEVAEELDRRGRPVLIRAIGNCPPELQQHRLMDWLGWINKGSETQKFLRAVDSFSLGCLLSSAEPLGISTLECLRLGVPVMGTNVGGIPDCIPENAGILLEASAGRDTIADAAEQALFDSAAFASLCQNARRQMAHVTWADTAKKMHLIWTKQSPAARFPENT